MIAAFFGVPEGNTSTTGNLISVALMSYFQYQAPVLMASLSEGVYGLEDAFLPMDGMKIAEEAEYFYQQGMDMVLKEVGTGEIRRDLFLKACTDLIPGKLSYLPTAKSNSQQRVWAELLKYGDKILDCMEELFEVVFLDCGKGNGPFMEKVAKRAEVIVINLTQSQRILNQYFLQKHHYLEKTVFLVGQYEELFPCNKNYILKNYRLPSETVKTIQYSTGFRDAFEHGKCFRFFQKNVPIPMLEKNRSFMEDVKGVTDCILRKGGYLG